jgi:hypothetical protein
MTHHEVTFNRAVMMVTAALSAGHIRPSESEAIQDAILSFCNILVDAEFAWLDGDTAAEVSAFK